jgi:hypothetical protein
MSTLPIRAASMVASITLAALSSAPAIAELPRHHHVVTLRPLPTEHGVEEGFPKYSGFGGAVAIRNGIAFVGIQHGIPDSRVAVYGQTASSWVRTGTLTVEDPLLGGRDGFGRAIVFRDGLAVIASYTFLHVFKRVNGVWTDVQKIAPPPGSPTDFWEFNAIRLENGILVISSNVLSPKGVAYLYELAANGKFQQRATLQASVSPLRFDAFGSGVAVAGNVVVIGDPVNAIAYVFRRRSDGTWVEAQRLMGADTSVVGSFGDAVAIDQGMIIVGAPGHECLESEGGDPFCDPFGESPPGPDGIGAGGAAYGFVPIAGQYVQVLKLRPSRNEHADYFQFGRRILMMGKYVVIDAAEQSSAGDFDGGIPNGLSFTYDRDGSHVTARGLTAGYVISDSIGLANNWLMVGASRDPDGLHCQSFVELCLGEATVFDLNRYQE